jgi:pyruvate/2-oxoglutarate dehydrogenase complex dihydrolipoamide acyltransferase (E2) component
VTLMPFFIKAVALAVKATPEVNRILFRRFPLGKRIVRFDVVDVNVPVTREVDGEMVTFIGTIRGADKLTVGQIQDELEKLQRGAPDQSPSIEKYRRLKRSPPIVASIFHWLMTRSPAFYLKNAGTCSLSTLDGMRGDHFFSVGPTTSLFCIGGIGDEVVARDGAPVVRRMLKAALALDNYVVSGLDGVVLARTFQELVESCSFIDEELAAKALAVGTPAPQSVGAVA